MKKFIGHELQWQRQPAKAVSMTSHFYVCFMCSLVHGVGLGFNKDGTGDVDTVLWPQ